MLRNVLTVLLVILAALAAAVFATQNPGTVTLDLALVRLEDVRIAIAFAVCFGLGWLFGVLTVGTTLLRLVRQRRKLRKNLETAETEISSLRSLPMQDAD
jgi:uncharacterized membrane protein YciS (DUF1049 family)